MRMMLLVLVLLSGCSYKCGDTTKSAMLSSSSGVATKVIVAPAIAVDAVMCLATVAK